MVAEWRSDLNRSARDFAEIVWPAIRSRVTGGDIIPVETGDDNLRQILDRLAGIDAWQVVETHGMRGLASRVQKECEKSYDTFTIRYRRDNSTTTEFDKRLRSFEVIDNYGNTSGWLYPHLTIQAYLGMCNEFLAAAIVRTRDLFLWAEHERDAGISWTPSNKHPYLKHNGTNATMLVCPWAALSADNVKVHIIRAADVVQETLFDPPMA